MNLRRRVATKSKVCKKIRFHQSLNTRFRILITNNLQFNFTIRVRKISCFFDKSDSMSIRFNVLHKNDLKFKVFNFS